MFEKGAIPKWSLSTHKVTGHLAGKRYILDNDKSYLYYQLKRVGSVSEAPTSLEEEKEEQQPARVLPIEPKKTRLALKKEGVDLGNVRRGLRERKPTHQVLTEEGERINW